MTPFCLLTQHEGGILKDKTRSPIAELNVLCKDSHPLLIHICPLCKQPTNITDYGKEVFKQ